MFQHNLGRYTNNLQKSTSHSKNCKTTVCAGANRICKKLVDYHNKKFVKNFLSTVSAGGARGSSPPCGSSLSIPRTCDLTPCHEGRNGVRD